MESVKTNGSGEQAEIAQLQTENATLRDQMLQANLHELMQRRKNDALQEEIECLRAAINEPNADQTENHD